MIEDQKKYINISIIPGDATAFAGTCGGAQSRKGLRIVLKCCLFLVLDDCPMLQWKSVRHSV